MKQFSIQKGVAFLSIAALSTFMLAGCGTNTSEITFDEAYKTFVNNLIDSDSQVYKDSISFISNENFDTKTDMSFVIKHKDARLSFTTNSNTKNKETQILSNLEEIKQDRNIKFNIDVNSNFPILPATGSAKIGGELSYSLQDLVLNVKLSNPIFDIDVANEALGIDQIKTMVDSQLTMFKDKRYKLDIKQIPNYEQIKQELLKSQPFMNIDKQKLMTLSTDLNKQLLGSPIFIQTGEQTTYNGETAYKVMINKESLTSAMYLIIDTISTGDQNTMLKKELAFSTGDLTINKDIEMYMVIYDNDEIGFIAKGEVEDNKLDIDIKSTKSQINNKISIGNGKKQGTINIEGKKGENANINIDFTEGEKHMVNINMEVITNKISNKNISANINIDATIYKDALTNAGLPAEAQSDIEVSMKVNTQSEVIGEFEIEKHTDVVDVMSLLGAMMPPANMGTGNEEMYDEEMYDEQYPEDFGMQPDSE